MLMSFTIAASDLPAVLERSEVVAVTSGDGQSSLRRIFNGQRLSDWPVFNGTEKLYCRMEDSKPYWMYFAVDSLNTTVYVIVQHI